MAMTGYDLASQVLTDSSFHCDALLNLTDGQETDWLEFKAVLFPPKIAEESKNQSASRDKTNEVDYFWHVAKAVIAMANTQGGAVLLGVSDDGEPVDVAHFDPHGYLQTSSDVYFRRSIDRALLPENKKWATGTQGVWMVDQLPTQLIDLRLATLKGKPVVVILVRPLPIGSKPIKCVESVNGVPNRTVIFCRQSGELGRVREIIDFELIQQHVELRKVVNPNFEGLWKKYKPADLESAYEQVLRELELIKKRLNRPPRRKRVSKPAPAGTQQTETNLCEPTVPQTQENTSAEQDGELEFNAIFELTPDFIDRTKIFVDSDTLMHAHSSSLFNEALCVLLKKYSQTILISERTIDFFHLAKTKADPSVFTAAESGLNTLYRLQVADCVTDCKDPYPIPGDPYATDKLFHELFVKYQQEFPLCLITQNDQLAQRIWQSANSAAFSHVKPVTLLFLDEAGVLRQWFNYTNSQAESSVNKPKKSHTFEAELAEDFKILADTSSLMLYDEQADRFTGHEFFNRTFLPHLQRAKNSLIVPIHVTLEVQRHLKSNKPLLAKQAHLADEVLSTYLRHGLLDIGSDTDETERGKTFADQVFVRLAIRYSGETNLCFITQDRNLAKLLLEQKPQTPQSHSLQFKVLYINYKSARLSDWVTRFEKEALNEGNRTSGSTPGKSHQNIQQAVRMQPQNSARSVESKSDAPRAFDARKVVETPVDAAAPAKPFLIKHAPVRENKSILPCSFFPSVNDRVKTRLNKDYKLVSEVSSGGEGTIYRTSDDNLVCKVFFPHSLTVERRDKLELMLSRQITVKGVCWPKELIFNDAGEFVGYLMPLAKGKILKTSVLSKSALARNFPSWNRIQLTQLAITVLKTYDQLHSLNVFVGDINPQNIMVVNENEVYIVDTDSFQVEGFPCPVGTETYTPPARLGQNYAHFLRTLDDELFAVSVLLFMILFPGKGPFSAQGGGDVTENMKNRIFPYGKQASTERNVAPKGAWQFIWSHLHPKLKEHFEDIFARDRRVKIPDLLKPLINSIRDMKDQSRNHELFPSQPRLTEGKTVTMVCAECGLPEELNEKTADTLRAAGRPFRHNHCSTMKQLQRVENTRNVACAICGTSETVALAHLDNLKKDNRAYWCSNCKTSTRRQGNPYQGRAGRSRHSNERQPTNVVGPILVGLVLIMIFYFLSR